MIRMKSLFAVLAIAATVAVVPFANAQVVHFVGAGSSAMFQGFAVAAVNDLAAVKATANPGYTVHHWSIKATTAPANMAGLQDSRTPLGGSPPPVEFGSFWAVWVNDNAGNPTDVWAYLSVDSTVGVRTYLASPRANLLLTGAVTSTAGVNVVPQTLFVAPWNVPDDASLPNTIYLALSGPLGKPITAGMTDIRPEDALLATNRILGSVPAGGFPNPNPFTATTANPCPPTDTKVPGSRFMCSSYPYFYSFSLGYGPAPIGNAILSSQSATKATPVAFALPGFNDPITSQPVPATIKVFPIGESPIVFIANRQNPAGLGQIIGNLPSCGGTNPIGCIPGGYTSDGSYYVRNVWDQHPYPPTGAFPSTSFPATGYCSVVANQGTATCHITRRPLGNLFAGNLCEGVNTAFTWPLDPAIQGTRATVPNGVNFPVHVMYREPLSGTYNTTEWTEIRRFGNTQGNLNTVSGLYGKPPYISQESNVVPSVDNPLNKQCEAAFGEPQPPNPAPPTEGLRRRVIGTGEMVATVKATQDSLGYAFFSFGNVNSIARSTSWGYLMVNGIDPIFADYQNSVGNPGQPAAPGSPTTWGELPNCTPGGSGVIPDCTASAVWLGGNTYPHLRDGTYPSWSELRLLCDTNDFSCTTDPLGALALIQNLQADIHFEHLGGVPDLLPFASGGPAVFGNGVYGDASFVRAHYSFVQANDAAEFNNAAPYSNASPATTHQSNATVHFGGATVPSCPVADQAVNGPTPADECGGDAGGFIIAAPPAGGASSGQLQ